MAESEIKSIGIIMDGNRRWAKERGFFAWQGHEEGYKKLREVLNWCKEKNIMNVFLYAFSTENWNRAEEEVLKMMDLLRKALGNEIDSLKNEKVRVKVAGDVSRFPEDIQRGIKKLEEETKDFTEGNLILCLSYGGRAEILNAVNRITKDGKKDISEEDFEKYLWTAGAPDPDIIIRTSGEKRLSGFLPWQSVYSELFFVDTYWPAFSKEEFEAILEEYKERERRNGK